MARILTFLAQDNPSVLTAKSLYSPTQPEQPILKKIYICNTTVLAATYTLYYDDRGSTFDATTMISTGVLAATTSTFIELDIPMNVSNGSLGIKTTVANAINFTLFGEV